MWLVLSAVFAVLPPEGWVASPELAAQLPADAGIERHAYRPPDDPVNAYIFAHAANAYVLAPGDAIARLTAAAKAAGASIASVTRDHGIDEVVIDGPDGIRTHLRVASGIVGSGIDVTIGMCRGRGAPLAACEARLAAITVPVSPAIDDAPLWRGLYGLIGLFAAAIVAGSLGARWLGRRALRRSPPLVDRELVTIAGFVRATSTVEAPLSGRACVAHRSRVLARAGERCEQAVVPFVVETRHGPVQIAGPEVAFDVAPSALVDRPTPRMLAFRSRHAVAADEPVGFDEIVVETGAKITIRGMIAVSYDLAARGERGYRDDAPAIVQLVPAGQPVTVLRVW